MTNHHQIPTLLHNSIKLILLEELSKYAKVDNHIKLDLSDQMLKAHFFFVFFFFQFYHFQNPDHNNRVDPRLLENILPSKQGNYTIFKR